MSLIKFSKKRVLYANTTVRCTSYNGLLHRPTVVHVPVMFFFMDHSV